MLVVEVVELGAQLLPDLLVGIVGIGVQLATQAVEVGPMGRDERRPASGITPADGGEGGAVAGDGELAGRLVHHLTIRSGRGWGSRFLVGWA